MKKQSKHNEFVELMKQLQKIAEGDSVIVELLCEDDSAMESLLSPDETSNIKIPYVNATPIYEAKWA